MDTVNLASGYGVTIQPAAPNAAGLVWRVESVRHLPPGENGGRHHCYFDVYDLDGRPMRDDAKLRGGWTWLGRHGDEPAPPALLEKRAPEPMGNIALGRGQIASVWIEGDGVPSDIVAGLSTDHPDESGDVTRGHHSFAVVWRKVLATPAQPPAPVQPPQPPISDDERAAIASGLRRVADTLEGGAIDLRHLANAVEAMGLALGMAQGEAKG